MYVDGGGCWGEGAGTPRGLPEQRPIIARVWRKEGIGDFQRLKQPEGGYHLGSPLALWAARCFHTRD